MARRTSDDALYKNKEWLKEKYEVDKISSLEIAKLCGVRKKAILYYLHKFNLMQPPLGEKALITSQTEQLIIGTVLGDASLPLRKKNPRLSVGHRVEDIEYLRWKYNILKSAGLVSAPIHYYNIAIFDTVSSPYLWEYRRLFYRDGQKVLSKRVLSLLTPFSLAIWYMDDGSFFQCSKYSARVRIATDCFSKKENNLASDMLYQKFGFRFGVHRHEGKWILQMSKGDMIAEFLNIVKPYIHPAMTRKCPQFIPITEKLLSEGRSERAKKLWQDPQVRRRILLGREEARLARCFRDGAYQKS